MLVCLIASLATAETEAGELWDWKELAPEQQIFCDTYMPPFLEIRKNQGDEAALKELERIYQLVEQQFDDGFFFHRVIWYEAQIHSGKEDEEWGLKLYEYLYERDVVNGTRFGCSCNIHVPHYILYGNIMILCNDLGKAAKMHGYALKVEDSLLADRKFDLTGASYTDNGPIFSFLNKARKREYPIFSHDLNPSVGSQKTRDFIYYSNIFALNYVSHDALRSGDWVKAAELSAWCIRYVDEYMVDQTLMKRGVDNRCGYDSRKILSNLAMLHGYPDEAARFLKEYIDHAEGYYKTGETGLMNAKLNFAVVQISTGELTKDALILADTAAQTIADDIRSSRADIMFGWLNKARIYHALGHRQEAWIIVDELFEKTAKDVNLHHWVRMLDTAIDLALADGGTRPELEAWLVLALDNARLAGNKFEELPLYEKYAQFLMIKGRYAEAVQIQQEAVRLSKAMNLPKRLEDNLATLASMNQAWENQNLVQSADTESPENAPNNTEESTTPSISTTTTLPASETGGSTAKTIAVDIQPRSSISASLQGQAAYGRFYVYNTSIVAQQGVLYLTGPIDQIQWQNEEWLTASASPVFESVQVSHDLKLEAGESCIIDITGLPLEDGRGAAILCQWIPGGQHDASVSGSWSYQTAETEKRTAVIDAHEIQNNPFYLIPIHHMVQRIDTTQQQVVDFSVQASSPMRIESYNAATGKLLSVDANGDGDFQDRGDLIVSDDNRNSWPDLVFEQSQKLSSLVMYVQPCEPTTADTELTISIQINDVWQTDAVDVIKPYSPLNQ